MSFLAPERLFLLAVPAVVAGAYIWAQHRRAAYAVRFTNLELLDRVAPEAPGWRRHLPAAALLAALISLAVATARPAASVEVPQEEATVVLAIDVSLSMDADDVEPNRLEAAKAAAASFLEQVPEEMNVGLVSFSGAVTVLVPPTTDHTAVEASIGRLQLGPGTAIGEAIFSSLDLIAETEASSSDPASSDSDTNGDRQQPAATILVLSDGETTAGRPDAMASAAAGERGIPISTVAFGTDQGEVSLPDGIVPVPVNEAALAQVAGDTGGEFFDADSSDDLRSVFEGIGSEIGREVEERELTDWFAAAGLLFAGLAAAGSIVWFSRLP